MRTACTLSEADDSFSDSRYLETALVYLSPVQLDQPDYRDKNERVDQKDSDNFQIREMAEVSLSVFSKQISEMRHEEIIRNADGEGHWKEHHDGVAKHR